MKVRGRKVWSLILFMVVSSCSLRSDTKTIKRTENFIEIEAQANNVWIDCFEINPEDHLSLMRFFVKDGITTHKFLYRRLFEARFCPSNLKKYRKLLKGAHRITVVGIANKYEPEETTERIGSVPEEFAIGHKKLASWTFIRLQSEKGCEAYFNEDCKPENYWGGLIPQE